MNHVVIILLASWLAGATAFVGGIIAKIEGSAETTTKREIIHGVIAFGGGILIAAVAFALVPEGMSALGPVSLTVVFCAGGIMFCILDAYLSRRGGTRAQFMAMLMDFVPEAISLGAVFGHNQRLGFLLAAFIGAQNLPEGFNSYREILKSGGRPRTTLATLLAISLLGPIAACSGYMFLHDQPKLTAGIMSFAAGGILYLIFQDIAPQSRMRRHWTPPLGAVLGFVVGMIGKQLIG
ncbi:MAG TPA: divalent cation transporter [Deltaproteobacteria bacterium]|nr:divalent cation transporter [Deltaproteobacteria bacterium]HPJ92497.1 divalent cation transporter [Deltaproteobacteria bacterium]HPR52153.1 divalent cation transporter [Deltaproteobacteria bacterium]